MKKLFNKRNLIMLAVILIIIYVGFFSFINRGKVGVEEKIDINNASISYQDLKLGSSSEDDVRNKFGTPLSEREADGKKILEYESKNPNFNNEIVINSNKLYFVKQIISPSDNISIVELKNKYGNFKNILYGNGSDSGFHLFIYPEKGVAFIGNEKTTDVLEVWYFAPTTYENFKTLYAKEYTEEEVQDSQ
ncbi:MAG: hypothetical protein ACHQUA_01455 [Microgenomates group bacterium]